MTGGRFEMNQNLNSTTRGEQQFFMRSGKNMMNILGSRTSHIVVTIIGAFICFLPIVMRIPSNLEDTTLGATLRGEMPNVQSKAAAVAGVVLAAPIVCDLLFDLILSRSSRSVEIRDKNRRGSMETYEEPSFNIPERILFLASVLLISICILLPSNTPGWGFIVECSQKCSVTLLFGSISASMSRFSIRYFPGIMTTLSIMLFAAGSIIGSFITNTANGITFGPPFVNYLRLVCIFGFSGLFIVQSCLWAFFTLKERLSKMRQERIIQNEREKSRDADLVFQSIHISFFVTYYFICLAFQIIVKNLSLANDGAIFFVMIPYVLYELAYIIFCMRFAKHRALQSLVRRLYIFI
jgi:hypothetical protein